MNQSGFNGMSRCFFSWLFLHQQHHSLAAFPKKDAERAMEEMHEKRVLVKASECNDLHDETTMFFVSCFLFASWGFWQVFPKEVGLKQSPVFSPWDTWTSRAGSNSGTTCCPPKTWHATCATTATDPGRWPLQKVKQLEWVWMLPKSNCQHVGRHRVFFFKICCVIVIFSFFSFLSYHHGQKRRLANQKSVDKKQPLDDGGGVFFQFCFGTCHRCPSQRVLQSLPQGLWNLRACQKRRGEKSQNLFFGAALAGSKKGFCGFVWGVWRRIFVDVFSLGFSCADFFPQMTPCFDWTRPCFGGFFRPKIEAHSQVPGMYTWSVTVTGEALVSLIKEGHELKEGHVIKTPVVQGMTRWNPTQLYGDYDKPI